jgi:hypothetical protein
MARRRTASLSLAYDPAINSFVIASEAKQSSFCKMDCFVALLLAMTM